ncbi:MAG: hypothetical protein ACRCZ4_01435 [Plesiomonas sp.]|uniref:hypothetical protein n=1 Tax=Plesiomonas sp. TaxID=2486279 RepID=UPI003EE5A996
MKQSAEVWLEQELMLQEVIRTERLRHLREEQDNTQPDTNRRSCRRRQIKRSKKVTL